MDQFVIDKTRQANAILAEMDIDLWMTFVQETSAMRDPVLPLIYGNDLTWHSAILLGKHGEAIAIVGSFETDTARRTGAFHEVIGYDEGIRAPLLEVLNRLDPKKIALNYSEDDPFADGLSLGLYRALMRFLEGTPYAERIVSAAPVILALRGRKTPGEIAKIRAAVAATDEIFNETFKYIKPGLSEKQVWAFMQDQLASRGLGPAWDADYCPIFNAGKGSPVGHVLPTDLKVQPGSMLHFDFGVRKEGYCSDIQHMAYMLAPGEEHAPKAVSLAVRTLAQAIQNCFEAIKPGVPGHVLDAITRKTLVEAGYPEFKHATGHQVGLNGHDGGALIGPGWERYADTPNWPLEAGQVFTLEPSIYLEDYGIVGLEEMVLVTEDGAEYLSQPQTEIILLKS